MSKQEIEFRDPVVKRVVNKFIDRSNEGYNKYGRTLHDERSQGLKDLAGYLNDVQEELMDAILYIQSAREDVRDWLEEIELKRIDVIGQNGNDGLHYDDEEV
tara:strand:+ start:1057 stop:1362 length:306 start_codon:yes stop_codon:yes gene_type:complete